MRAGVRAGMISLDSIRGACPLSSKIDDHAPPELINATHIKTVIFYINLFTSHVDYHYFNEASENPYSTTSHASEHPEHCRIGCSGCSSPLELFRLDENRLRSRAETKFLCEDATEWP